MWFVIPKIIIHQKYRLRKMALIKPAEEGEDNEMERNNRNNNYPEDEEEVI